MAAERLSPAEKVQAYSQEAISLLLDLRQQRPLRVQSNLYELSTPYSNNILLAWDHDYETIDPLFARDNIFHHLLRSAGQPAFPLSTDSPEISLIAFQQLSTQRFNAYQLNLYFARFHAQQVILFEHLHVDLDHPRHHYFRYPYPHNINLPAHFLARNLAALRSFFNPVWV